jgi:hypothetical protein
MLPPLLEQNPDLKKLIIQCATSNLNELTAELLLACLHNAALPALLEKFQEESGNPECAMHDLFQEHRLTKISASTVCRWMRRLGFKCELRQKCCYVDGQEKPETKAHRKKFVRRHFADEMLMHHWMQIQLAEKLRLEEHGCHCVDAETEVEMVEFHVDDHHAFQDKMNSTTRFRGNLSVRKPSDRKPVIGFGQDEAVMKQRCFTTEAWTAPSGQKAINQGHCRHDHMVLQFEDCIDIVNTSSPEFDCVFLFDHSCGHDRQRPDGLTVTGLSKGLGGAQQKLGCLI